MYADTTYNLGDFYVTLLSYKHLMLEDIRTGKSPVLLVSCPASLSHAEKESGETRIQFWFHT